MDFLSRGTKFDTYRKIRFYNTHYKETDIKTVIYIGKNEKQFDYESLNVTHYHFSLDDDEDSDLYSMLDDLYDIICKGLEIGDVFVHCASGMSCSTSAVLYYLVRSGEFDNLIETLEFLKNYRPHTEPIKGSLNKYIKNV